MNTHTYRLRPEWIIGFSILLCLSGMSILVPTCRGQNRPAAHVASAAPAATSPAPADAADADKFVKEDGAPDHWNDHRYRKEATRQMGIIAGITALVIVKGLVSRHQTRRSMRHA